MISSSNAAADRVKREAPTQQLLSWFTDNRTAASCSNFVVDDV
jgi:hypothetical protein